MNNQIPEFNGSTKLTINTEQSRSVKIDTSASLSINPEQSRGIDSYSPQEMAERVKTVGVRVYPVRDYEATGRLDGVSNGVYLRKK